MALWMRTAIHVERIIQASILRVLIAAIVSGSLCVAAATERVANGQSANGLAYDFVGKGPVVVMIHGTNLDRLWTIPYSLIEQSSRAALEHLEDTWRTDGIVHVALLERVVDLRLRERGVRAERHARALRVLPFIDAPTMVLVGENDEEAILEQGVLLRRRMPNARLVTVPGGGHLLTGISDLPAPDGPFIHLKAAQRTKRLFVTASSRFRGRQLSAGGRASH